MRWLNFFHLKFSTKSKWPCYSVELYRVMCLFALIHQMSKWLPSWRNDFMIFHTNFLTLHNQLYNEHPNVITILICENVLLQTLQWPLSISTHSPVIIWVDIIYYNNKFDKPPTLVWYFDKNVRFWKIWDISTVNRASVLFFVNII